MKQRKIQRIDFDQINHQMINVRVEVCVCCCLVKLPQGVLQHMLAEFVQDGDFVVWSLDIVDFSNKGTSERDGAKVNNCTTVGLKTSANQQLQQTNNS